ncbi:MAG: hypothetical protein KC996_09475 [Phycisphaerales bacterium]|nr:hypothetical protein [Phycisphaerales bacterium]
MRWTGSIILSAACATASANGLVEFTSSPDLGSPRLLVEFTTPEPLGEIALNAALYSEEVTRLRMQGADLTLIQRSAFDLPAFDAVGVLRSDWEKSPLVSLNPISDGLTIGSDIRFDVGRSTALRDGGIAGSHGTLANDTNEDKLPSFAQGEGEYDLYNLALSWDAITTDELRVHFTSGLKAIDVNINKRFSANGSSGMHDEQRVAALPVVGTGVEWYINEHLSISGSAQTHPIEGSASIVDVSAMTAYSVSDSVRFSVGYSLVRSSFEVGSIATELTQEGLFARLQISF